MVVYYINKVSERLADCRYPVKEGDVCMLYDGDAVKSIYIDSETDDGSIWRDFKFIDTKSLKSYQFPKSDSIICAPVGEKHAIGDTRLLTQLIQECKGEWLLDFLNETSAVLSGFVDYWDLQVLRRLTGVDDIEIEYGDEEALSCFTDKPEEEEEEEWDEEEDDDIDIIPKSHDIKWFCLSALACIEDQMDKRSYQILHDTLKGVPRSEIASRFHLTQERIRQIVVKATKQAKGLLTEQRKSLEEAKAENAKLKVQMNLLREDMAGLKAMLPKDVIMGKSEEDIDAELTELLETPLKDINLSVRALNTLGFMGVKKFADIPQIESDMTVLKVRNSGRKTVHDISRLLEDFYLTFGMSLTETVDVLKANDWHAAKRKWIKGHETEESAQNEMIEEDDDAQRRDETTRDEVEHVFLNPSGKVEGSFTLPVNSENRSGMPWSSEEEKLVSNYYNQGQSFSAIAKAIGRTEIAVMSRLGMMGVIDYTYGQEYKPNEEEVPAITDDNDEEPEEAEFDGKELAERYFYPVQDNLFWDEEKQVYEIYLADSYELVVNHLIFDVDRLNEIEAKSEGLTEDEKEELFSDYWYDNHINIIARMKPGSDGFELLQFETGPGIQKIVYKPGEYTYIRITDEDDGLDKFIDYNGVVYDSPEQIMATTNTEVARYHDFYDAPKHVTKEYIRLGMIEIKRIYKGGMKKVTVFTDSELGQAIKNDSEEIWMLDRNSIITKLLKDEDSAYPFKVYFCNGVKMNDAGLEAVKTKSLVLQAQLFERLKKLQASLKKKKEKIRHERQFKEIVSTLFCFKDDSNDKEDSTSQ